MSAVAELPINAPANNSGWMQRMSTMDRSQRLRLGVGVVLLVAVVVVAIVLGRQQDYRVLFANLSDKDGGAIVAQLTQMNVPYKYADGGGAILIPANRVHDVRLRLATQGLPKGSVTGFELMETTRFGVTQFQERLNFQRGLEGELTRSIQALASVQSARVHLALPNQNGFFREQQKPSASVLLSLHPGRVLDRAQLAGIVHLVASSVPELAPSAVSVLDDTGKLLSQAPDGVSGEGIDAQQLLYVQQLEQQYARRIMDILEPVVGRNNVKAQVSAEVDFSQTESTSEQYRPNQTPDATTIRSQQVVEVSGATDRTGTGVPGAVSNQPPGTSAAPINGANPATNAAGQQQAAQDVSRKRESITNYEIDKTVRVTRGNNWAIKRLSAAVVVNHQSAEERGKIVTKALSPEQIEQMTALVRETIGYNRERGDSVNLMNALFQVEKPAQTDVPLWKQAEVIDLARSSVWPLGAVLLAALIILGLVRPALKSIGGARKTASNTQSQIDALEADTPPRPALPPPVKINEPPEITPEQIRMEEARALAKENPMAVANILKSWVNGEAA